MILPKYPVEVIRNGSLRRNLPTETRSRQTYREIISQLPLTDDRYKPDQYGTKCNFYVRDCILLMGYILPHIVANEMVRLADAGDLAPFQPMVIQDAIKNANLGCPTFAGLEAEGHGHVVMVPPQLGAVDQLAQHPGYLLISQAGRRNLWMCRMALAWLASDLPRVKFYGAP